MGNHDYGATGSAEPTVPANEIGLPPLARRSTHLAGSLRGESRTGAGPDGSLIDGTLDERAQRGVQTRPLVAATLRRLAREAALRRGCRSEAARSPRPSQPLCRRDAGPAACEDHRPTQGCGQDPAHSHASLRLLSPFRAVAEPRRAPTCRSSRCGSGNGGRTRHARPPPLIAHSDSELTIGEDARTSSPADVS